LSLVKPIPIAAFEGTPSRVPGAEDTRLSWLVLTVLFTVYFFSSVDRALFGILAQPVKEELLLADWELGFLTGFAFSLLQLTFGLVIARLADQRNRVTILSVCITLWSVMTALCGLAVNFIQLCLFRMGVGIGEAACLPASHSLISDYFPPANRTKALAIYGLGYPLGGLIGTIVAGVVLDHWGWRNTFYVVGLPGVFVALMTWRLVKEPIRGRFDSPAATAIAATAADAPNFAQPKSYAEVSRLLWRSPAVRHMIIALVSMSFATAPTATFLGPFLVRKFPISYTQLGFIIGTTMMLGASISTIVGGIIAQRLARWDPRWLMWLPAITVAAGMPLYVTALAQPTWLGLAIWMFFGALTNATYLAPSYTVLYNAVPPGGRAKAALIVQILMGVIGFSAGPLLAGAANDIIASKLFGNPLGQSFTLACPGGQAAKGATALLTAACHTAVADSTQIVLIATMVLTIWPAWHFFLSGRYLKRTVGTTNGPPP
jgi:MFS family permease